ncbi:MAG: hypothetical protein IT372_01895, partial [Polyangiaceae bacterium]|nr:hypothetical protein [Polyangiaceae bacterium]
MDLVDLIEKRRFVGREFLVWLWFESELFEGRFEVEGLGPCEVLLEGQITLVQEKEQSKLKGAAPSAAPEAHEALRQGKLPTHARVRVRRGELEYAFLFNADTLGLSGVNIPSQVREETDEMFYERMYLVEELEELLGAIYGDFIALRLSTAWESDAVPAIRAWIRGEAVADPEALRRLRRRVPPLGRAPRARST